MEERAKETIVIVHGTWAVPKPQNTQWYQRPNDGSPTDGFVSKLDAALRARGSPAQCWAHCTKSDPIFQWSGENSWIARTNAAGALAEYLAKLREAGWLCHIVAHSHGGNVVMEALPPIIAAEGPDRSYGKIVTLGSPFMDTMSPILKRIERTRRTIDLATWMVYGLGTVWLFWYAWFSYFEEKKVSIGAIFLALMAILNAAIFFRSYPRIRSSDPRGIIQDQLRFFAMGSRMDEAWQVLHHIGTMENPLNVKSSLLQYLFASLRSGVSRAAQRERIYGAKSYRDLAFKFKLVLAALHALTVVFILMMIFAVAVIAGFGSVPWSTTLPMVMIWLGFGVAVNSAALWITAGTPSDKSFYSAFLSPFRWCGRLVASLGLMFPEMATFFIRRRGWSVLLAIAMGLEGYRFKMPAIEQYPRNLPEKCVKYENMPVDAEQRAIERRSAWVDRHLEGVSRTFAKLVVTASDMTLLLRTIENDQTLVHAAYYTDDACIARIADWISGRS
jgi:hypothetical protein